jgi:hypothetical protein
MALSAASDLIARIFHEYIAPPLSMISSVIGTLCLLLFFILNGCLFAVIFSRWTNIHPSAFIGLLILVEVPALMLLLSYVLDHLPTLQETDIFIWVRFVIASFIPGVLLAASISRTRYLNDRILQQRRGQTNRVVEWIKSNHRHPSATEMHDLDNATSDNDTELLPTNIEKYLQCFYIWWVKFANWACDLTMIINRSASLHSPQEAAGVDKKTLFTHTAAFLWPAWLILVYLILYSRMLACMWWLKSKASMIFHVTIRYAFSWHFVELLVWSALVTGAVHWLLKHV